MKFGRVFHLGSGAGAVGVLVAGLLAASTGGALAGGGPLYVSPSGASGNADTSCATAKYSTINSAVAAAPAGGTVVVCHGTYAEDVAIAKSLTLVGRLATIDATGLDNGVMITHSWVRVSGFIVVNALGEGILAQGSPVAGPIINGQPTTTGIPITHVTITLNTVRHNDLGTPSSGYPECQAQGPIPGDCGEGIHLWSVAYSWVANNRVADNSGGILLTDEFGPTHDNTITDNVVENNVFDCGVTVVSHNLGVDPTTLHRLKSFGGVYDNLVSDNVIKGNGTKGFGAGVVIAAPFPGAAAYHNTVRGNYIAGNGIAGVTLHAHAPGAFVGNNMILGNMIGKNNLLGDTDTVPPDMQTTGILVWSLSTHVNVVIAGNKIFDDHYGIWLNSAVSAPGAAVHNVFFGVAVPVKHA